MHRTWQINNGRKWLKKVQQDWNILQNNLPGTSCSEHVKFYAMLTRISRIFQSQHQKILTDEIYVRVYEDRMDLLRAAIVGAYGTPYQDGLFFFDFHLPPEYPDVPPVRYTNLT
jgi:ubiquitin-conjugating enzyme E2 O